MVVCLRRPDFDPKGLRCWRAGTRGAAFAEVRNPETHPEPERKPLDLMPQTGIIWGHNPC